MAGASIPLRKSPVHSIALPFPPTPSSIRTPDRPARSLPLPPNIFIWRQSARSAPSLLLLGIVCAYLEFKIPVATLPGVIAGTCFVLFFLGHYLAGLAGWEAVVFFVLGVTLVLIEVLFFAHSTIIFGVVGAFLILASLFWAMIDRYPDQPLVPSTTMLLVPMLNLSIAIIASMIVIALLARYLPRTSFYRRFALMAANPSGPSFSAPREFATSRSISPGTRGLAMTTLRPSGKGRFGDQIVDVITEGEFISAETPIVVSQIDGMRVLVARTQTSS